MKLKHLKYLLIFLSLHCFGLNITNANNYKSARPDTIDFWIIKLNGKEIIPSGNFKERIYVIEKVSDIYRFEIGYYTDTPCPNCPSKIELRNDKGLVIKKLDGTFDNSPFQISGTELKKLIPENGKLYIYFTGKKGKEWRQWINLGVVTFNK